MDLSFARSRTGEVTAPPVALTVLMVGVAARQAASPTARAQASLSVRDGEGDRLHPATGAFSTVVAAAITGWKEG